MPIGKLIFDLPEEENEFKIAGDAMNWALAIWDIVQSLRADLKYNAKNLDDKTLEEVQKEVFQILEDRNLNLGLIQ